MKKVFLIGLVMLANFSWVQEDIAYQKPSAEILALADYQSAPSITMDTKKEYMLLLYRDAYKTLDDLNQEEMRLGGLRVNPVTNISSTITYTNNIKIRKVKDTKVDPVQVTGLPENPKIAYLRWSPDDSKIAFTHTSSAGVELWVLDVKSAKASRLTASNLNANIGSPFSWCNDNKNLLVKIIPSGRPAMVDAKKSLPKGPTVSTAEGKVSQNRTYQDLLKIKLMSKTLKPWLPANFI